jgi:protein-arginine kinase activator protein McsA
VEQQLDFEVDDGSEVPEFIKQLLEFVSASHEGYKFSAQKACPNCGHAIIGTVQISALEADNER